MASHPHGWCRSSKTIRGVLVTTICACLATSAGGCSARSGANADSPPKAAISQSVLAIRDQRTLCNLPTFAEGSSEGEVDLGAEVVRALVYGEGDATVLAYEVILNGETQLKMRRLGSSEDRVVTDRVAKIVGFDGSGGLYFIEEDEESSLVRYDTETEERTAIAPGIVDAMVDTESESFAYLEMISDPAVDPLYTRLMYRQSRVAEPVEVDRTDDLRFHALALVTPEAVAYVENPGAGEQHGRVWLFDASTGAKQSIASGARVAAVAPMRDALVLGKLVLSGDVIVDRYGNAATDTESAWVMSLDGTQAGEMTELSDTEGAFVQAVFVGGSSRVAVASAGETVGGRVRYFDLIAGTDTQLFATDTEGVQEICAAPQDGCVICVVGTVDRGGVTWSQTAVVLAVDDSEAAPMFIPESGYDGTLDLLGAVGSGEG